MADNHDERNDFTNNNRYTILTNKYRHTDNEHHDPENDIDSTMNGHHQEQTIDDKVKTSGHHHDTAPTNAIDTNSHHHAPPTKPDSNSNNNHQLARAKGHIYPNNHRHRAPINTNVKMPPFNPNPRHPYAPYGNPTNPPPPRATRHFRLTSLLPLTILEDLSSVHHLLSQHNTHPTLAAELSALETFCACTWGLSTSQKHLTYARDHLGRPELQGEDLLMACRLEHGVECVYRNKGVGLFESCVEAVRAVDEGLGRVLESCRGDWMGRFRACG